MSTEVKTVLRKKNLSDLDLNVEKTLCLSISDAILL